MVESPVVWTLEVPQPLSKRSRESAQGVAQFLLLGKGEREAILWVEGVVQLHTPNGTVVQQRIHVVVVARQGGTCGIRNHADNVCRNLAEAVLRNDISQEWRTHGSIGTLRIVNDL